MLFFSLEIPRSSYGGTGGRSEYPWLSATELRYTPVCLVHPVYLVGLVYSVCLVHLVSFVQPNTRDRPDRPDRLDRPNRPNELDSE